MNNSSRAFTQAAHRSPWFGPGLSAAPSRGLPRSGHGEQDTAFLATPTGTPYRQHRAGPKGFIKANRRKNVRLCRLPRQQAIPYDAQPFRERSFLLDPARRQRAKLWGRARVIKNDPASIARLSIEAIKRNPSELPCSPFMRLMGIALAHSDVLYHDGDRGRACRRAIQDRRIESGNRQFARSLRKTPRIIIQMNHDDYDDAYIRAILDSVKTIAMVGISPKDNRPSFFAFKYLMEHGYRMIPVNPGQSGTRILRQKVYAKLTDIPETADMVDIFRTSEHVLPVVEEALKLEPRPRVIWMQLTVRNDKAAQLAEDAGLKVVMNRCPKIEYGRLSSEISWMGVNSRTLSSKRAQTLGKGVQRMRLGPVSKKDNG